MTQFDRSIFVRGLSYHSSIDDLQDYFSKYGPVKDVYLPKDHMTGKPRGFAYVKYESEQAADDCLANPEFELEGRTVHVEWATGERKTPMQMTGGRRDRYDDYSRRRYSPPRRRYDSPPRRRYDSPPRRRYDSPPRRRDDSPPYRSRYRDDSPPRRRRDDSPPRRSRYRDDSPPRSRYRDNSPVRSRFRDDSPPRSRYRDDSPPRSRYRDDSPPRSRHRDDSPLGSRNSPRDNSLGRQPSPLKSQPGGEW